MFERVRVSMRRNLKILGGKPPCRFLLLASTMTLMCHPPRFLQRKRKKNQVIKIKALKCKLKQKTGLENWTESKKQPSTSLTYTCQFIYFFFLILQNRIEYIDEPLHIYHDWNFRNLIYAIDPDFIYMLILRNLKSIYIFPPTASHIDWKIDRCYDRFCP